MKTMILAALAAISLSVATTQVVQAANFAAPEASHSSAPAGNMDFGPSGSNLEGGWG